MFNKQITSIDKTDITDLVANSVAEHRQLEYKELLLGNTDSEKKEFLADVSSFANAGGGDIIYGVAEKRDSNSHTTGLPESANGLAGINTDAETRRLENILRDGLTPRLAGIQFRWIDGFAQGPILLLRIPKSWNAPHMIGKGDSRFYSRNSAGKYPLDVGEIRAAFAMSASLPDIARRFREERIARIVADETPVPLIHPSHIIVHIIPIASLDPTYVVDLNTVATDNGNLWPMGSTGRNSRYNFDGFVVYDGPTGDKSLGYVQVFRNGILESVESTLLSYGDPLKVRVINNIKFEDRVANYLAKYLSQLDHWGIGAPYQIMITLVGVRNFVITQNADAFDGLHPIDRDVLMLPDLIAQENQTDVAVLLKPAFDTIWQASGLKGSWNYDKDGKWKARVY